MITLANLSDRYKAKLEQYDSTNAPPQCPSMDGVLLQLEVTNACNHKCVFCPNHASDRKKRFIDFNFAQRCIVECAKFLRKEKKICFHMNGEPFLYKQLPELIKIAKAEGFEYIFVTTNGTVGTNDYLAEIFASGLDSIKFSINAGTREDYLKITGRDDFDKAITALKFSDYWRKTHNQNLKIFVSCVGVKENKAGLLTLKNTVSDYCDEVLFYYPCAYAGQEIESARQMRCDLSDLNLKTFDIKHTKPCPVLWNSINITCDGYLALCCSSGLDNRLLVEDVREKSIKEVWLGKRMELIREKHVRGNILDTPCYSCITENVYCADKMNKDLFQWI